MIGDTLTLENLSAIYEAMCEIKPIDQSENYTRYFKEIEERLYEIVKDHELIKRRMTLQERHFDIIRTIETKEEGNYTTYKKDDYDNEMDRRIKLKKG